MVGEEGARCKPSGRLARLKSSSSSSTHSQTLWRRRRRAKGNCASPDITYPGTQECQDALGYYCKTGIRSGGESGMLIGLAPCKLQYLGKIHPVLTARYRVITSLVSDVMYWHPPDSGTGCTRASKSIMQIREVPQLLHSPQRNSCSLPGAIAR